MFETVGKSFAFSFKLDPAVLELSMTLIVNCLPIVIDDEVGDIDIVLRKCFGGIQNLFFCELLAEGIPCTCDSISGCKIMGKDDLQ